MRVRMRWLWIGMVVASLVWVTPAEAAKPKPVRSGTILFGVPVTGPQGCWSSPDCRLWLESGCDGRLSGLDPAISASVVDVRKLAGSRRRVVAAPEQSWLFRAHFEFWSRGCRRVGSHMSDHGSFRIPRSARWMTIPSSVGPVRWELR